MPAAGAVDLLQLDARAVVLLDGRQRLDALVRIVGTVHARVAVGHVVVAAGHGHGRIRTLVLRHLLLLDRCGLVLHHMLLRLLLLNGFACQRFFAWSGC